MDLEVEFVSTGNGGGRYHVLIRPELEKIYWAAYRARSNLHSAFNLSPDEQCLNDAIWMENAVRRLKTIKTAGRRTFHESEVHFILEVAHKVSYWGSGIS